MRDVGEEGGGGRLIMANDQVTISPRFAPPRGGPERDRRLGLGVVGVVAVAMVGFFFGWLLASPDPLERDRAQEAYPITTATTSEPFRFDDFEVPLVLAEPDEPLGEVVLGFTDSIGMLMIHDSGFDVAWWDAPQPTPEVVLSLDRDVDDWGTWPVGLDSSGRWFAEVLDELLTVYSVSTHEGDLADGEMVALRVHSPVWHETEPGQLAWLACPRGWEGVATLMTLDVSDEVAEPVAVRQVDDGCDGAALTGWSTRGTVLVVHGSDEPDWVLIDGEGTETPMEPGVWLVAERADGATLWTLPEPTGSSRSSFLLSGDGLQRTAVPGLADDEWLRDAVWSPNGDHLAMLLDHLDSAALRIVDLASGARTEVYGPDVEAMAWSTDGHYLLYSYGSGSGVLAFYGMYSDTTTTIALAEVVDEIRVHQGPPWMMFPDAPSGIDPAQVDAADIAPSCDPTQTEPPRSGDRSLDPATTRLVLGERTTLPDSARLDFLDTACGVECCRDAVVVDPLGVREDTGEWEAGVPFHVRHGFVNDAVEPLSEEQDVVVYVTRRSGPDLEDGLYELDHTYRFASDYVLRGVTDECGPGYWDQTELQTCEWFVHDFPEGFPAGRYDIWATWHAPCVAWQELGLADSCDDVNLVMSLFAGSVNMPFYGDGFDD